MATIPHRFYIRDISVHLKKLGMFNVLPSYEIFESQVAWMITKTELDDLPSIKLSFEMLLGIYEGQPEHQLSESNSNFVTNVDVLQALGWGCPVPFSNIVKQYIGMCLSGDLTPSLKARLDAAYLSVCTSVRQSQFQSNVPHSTDVAHSTAVPGPGSTNVPHSTAVQCSTDVNHQTAVSDVAHSTFVPHSTSHDDNDSTETPDEQDPETILPAGWFSAIDPHSHKLFYWNFSGTKQSNIPTEPAEVQAPRSQSSILNENAKVACDCGKPGCVIISRQLLTGNLKYFRNLSAGTFHKLSTFNVQEWFVRCECSNEDLNILSSNYAFVKGDTCQPMNFQQNNKKKWKCTVCLPKASS